MASPSISIENNFAIIQSIINLIIDPEKCIENKAYIIAIQLIELNAFARLRQIATLLAMDFL